eukprot:396337_1
MNNEIYKNIAKNIRSFMSFNEDSTNQIRDKEIGKIRKDKKAVVEEKCPLRIQIDKLSNISQKQVHKIKVLNKQIEQLTQTLHDIEGNDYIRPFKLYDSGLWNVSVGGTVMQSINYNSQTKVSSMIIGYYDSIVGYNSGIHKWSVKRMSGIRGVRSIGVISPRG